MAEEIERKFLVRDVQYRNLAEPVYYQQGYLSTEKYRTVVVRVAGDKGLLVIKGLTEGITRTEFEYEIPVKDAKMMLDELCEKPLIQKQRYIIEIDGLTWYVDEFHGKNEGLVVAEVELESEEQRVELPEWVGREVSGDPKYFNSSLVGNPYSKWGDD